MTSPVPSTVSLIISTSRGIDMACAQLRQQHCSQQDQLTSQTALRRFGTTVNVAAVVGCLCSDTASDSTAQAMAVPEGLVL